MKTMLIGLGPDYNYQIDNHNLWSADNTKYASNHGASLISRTLLDFFNADYIDDFTKINAYKKKYDLCVIAFATHITEKRDVSRYYNFVKKQGIKTIAFSLGIQDYSSSSSNVSQLHPSIINLLEYVTQSSGYIGVRGPYTASLLIKNGFKSEKIVSIGCPTIFRPLKKDFKMVKPKTFKKPLIVYHRTMSELNKKILSSAPLLGQDFLDEVIFDKNVNQNQFIKKNETKNYHNHKNGSFALELIKEKGIFYRKFDLWFEEIKKHDFVIGARLHGCIAAIIQGIPAVMIARDIRVQEIAEFYCIPYIKYEDIGDMTIEDIYDFADFTDFNKLYASRFNNLIKLLSDLNVLDKLSFKADVPQNFVYTKKDENSFTNILFEEINTTNLRLNELNNKLNRNSNNLNNLIKKLKKIPGFKKINKILNSVN